ncbi:MAG: hypothetical protein N3G48_01485 [Sulfolobales archaeon]|nr:hypothetical protein [Sulfolobales archaeon]
MKLDSGISPVISVTVLVGAVIILGLTFMAYSISLSNAQSSEVRLRNILVDEAAKTVIYIEKEERNNVNVTIYLGVTRVLPESARYRLTVFRANEYGTFYGLVPLSASDVEVYVKPPNINVVQPMNQTQALRTFLVESSGNYVPLSTLGLSTVNTYTIWYIPPNSTLIKLNIRITSIANFKYVVPVLLADFGSEYYEIARIYYLPSGWRQ